MADRDSKKTSTASNRREKRERRGAERREGDRRVRDEAGIPERRKTERRTKGPEAERRKVERRINEYRLEPAVLEFINAVNEFKSVHQKPFPTWTEIYQIFLSLGYRKADD